MKTIRINIERGKDDYAAWAEKVEYIYAIGETVEKVKLNIIEAIKLLKENNDEVNIPQELKGEYKLTFHLDLVSLLSYH